MKKEYVKPAMDCEVFAANEFVANCGYCEVNFSKKYTATDANGNEVTMIGCGAWVKAKDGSDLTVPTIISASATDVVTSKGWYSDPTIGAHRITEVGSAS